MSLDRVSAELQLQFEQTPEFRAAVAELRGAQAAYEQTLLAERQSIKSDPAYQQALVEKETGAVFVDRFMSTAMHYPCNYGYIPHTLSDDGDPCDVLVVSPAALITGVVVRCRPIGMLKMDDEAGGDAKILAVPIDKLSPIYRDVQSPRDLPALTTQQIAHFFEHYKDLEPGKWVKLSGWVDAEEAKREIVDSAKRYARPSRKRKA